MATILGYALINLTCTISLLVLPIFDNNISLAFVSYLEVPGCEWNNLRYINKGPQ